ncbi:12033_t:CDS:1, partial [Dentiscutata erythropus]
MNRLVNIYDENNKKRKRRQLDPELRKVYSNLHILSEYEKIKYHRVEHIHKEHLKDWHRYDNG